MTSSPHDELAWSHATGPRTATTIDTPTDGLDVGLVEVPAGDRTIPAYFAYPTGHSDRPVVLVLPEAFGLHAHIADVTRRFAHAGYFAVAPDLMVRQGDPLAYEDIDALVSDLLLTIPDEQVMNDLDATINWAGLRGADTGRVAANGFCWGGRWTWLFAAHRAIAAGVAWYGIVRDAGTFPEGSDLFPHQALDLADTLRTPVLGLYGERDDAIPLSTIEAMRDVLADGSPAARRSQIVTYPEAGHAFFADYRESYVAAAATDAWDRCLAWIDAALRE